MIDYLAEYGFVGALLMFGLFTACYDTMKDWLFGAGDYEGGGDD